MILISKMIYKTGRVSLLGQCQVKVTILTDMNIGFSSIIPTEMFIGLFL